MLFVINSGNGGHPQLHQWLMAATAMASLPPPSLVPKIGSIGSIPLPSLSTTTAVDNDLAYAPQSLSLPFAPLPPPPHPLHPAWRRRCCHCRHLLLLLLSSSTPPLFQLILDCCFRRCRSRTTTIDKNPTSAPQSSLLPSMPITSIPLPFASGTAPLSLSLPPPAVAVTVAIATAAVSTFS